MQPELESMFDRADELLIELEKEYNSCLKAEKVSDRAKNLTHEVLDKLRSILDHTMSLVWYKCIAPNLSEQEKKRVRVYFPIVDDLNAFHSTLGRGYMMTLEKVNKTIYNFLLKQQPFSSKENEWLKSLTEIVAKGKHVQLIPQKRIESSRIKITRQESGSVSWDPSSVKFGSGVSAMGAPVDPRTQRIVPTEGVTEQVELWISFILDDYGINALGFCKEACKKTRTIIEELLKIL